jgi:lysophospholipase L1-like esterase
MPAAPVHFALRALYAFGMLRQRAQVQPKDVPAVRSGDPSADRILVVGNGPSHGWGVLTHQLALTGQLADAIAVRTKRACDADLVGAEAMNIRSAYAWIGDRDLRDVDALILMVGFNDALRLTPLATWEEELEAALIGITSRLRTDALLAVVGIPPISSFRSRAGVIARLTDRHRRRLNAAAKSIADHRNIPYIELPVDDARAPEASAAVYRHFADGIADELAPRLLRARTPEPRAPQLDHVWDWSGTPAIVELARQGGETDLRRLAETAQKSFGVELAVVSLVDGDRLYHGTNTDVVPASVPLELSFCKYTVESGEPVIIPDTGKDPRFDGNPLVDVSFINFYAGYPLRSSGGDVIGSFCLQGSQPRRESAIALDLLRQLALEAQEVLRGYETEVPQYRFEQPMPTGEPIVFEK